METGLPLVVKARGTDILGLSSSPARAEPTQTVLRNADGLIAVSENLADNMIKLGANRMRTRVVYNGIDTSVFFPGDKMVARQTLGLDATPQILFVGNLVPVKQVGRPACRLPTPGGEGGRTFRCHIVGERAFTGGIWSPSRGKRGLGEKVIFHGRLGHGELPTWYRAADVIVLP